MLSYVDKTPIELTAVATIKAARKLEDAIQKTTIDFGADAGGIREMFQAFRVGDCYRETDESAIEALREQILGVLTERVPRYREIALKHDTDDFYFLDEELEATRQAWERLRSFIELRQSVLDTIKAQRQLRALRNLLCER